MDIKLHGSIENKEEINKNISVVFTKDGETADSYIEKEVNNLGRKYEIVCCYFRLFRTTNYFPKRCC